MKILAAVYLVIAGLSLLFLSGSHRSLHDNLMLWVNFFVLAYLIVVHGGPHLIKYLKGQGDVVADQLRKMEEKKDAMARELAETKRKIADRDKFLEELKERMRVRGEEARKKLVEQAKAEASQMLEDTKERTAFQILEAKKQYRAELIDMAVDLATEQLPRVMTTEDGQKMVDTYLEKVSSS